MGVELALINYDENQKQVIKHQIEFKKKRSRKVLILKVS